MRSRKNSSNLNIEDLGEHGQNSERSGANVTDEEKEDEFSKPMKYLYDLEELNHRKREQMYGNMYLITELYIAKQLNGNIIKTCLEDL